MLTQQQHNLKNGSLRTWFKHSEYDNCGQLCVYTWSLLQTGCVVPSKFDLDNKHIFGQAVYIVPFSDRDEVFVLLRVLIVKYFDDHLHTYVIEDKWISSD